MRACDRTGDRSTCGIGPDTDVPESRSNHRQPHEQYDESKLLHGGSTSGEANFSIIEEGQPRPQLYFCRCQRSRDNTPNADFLPDRDKLSPEGSVLRAFRTRTIAERTATMIDATPLASIRSTRWRKMFRATRTASRRKSRSMRCGRPSRTLRPRLGDCRTDSRLSLPRRVGWRVALR